MSLLRALYVLTALAASVEAAPAWVGAFFGAADKAALCGLVNATGSGATCDHMTLVFNPPPARLAALTQYFGVKEAVVPLAYGEDEHGAAILLRGAGTTPLPLGSDNAFPHTTTASAFAPPYTPAYSNCLLQRVVAAANATVSLDPRRRPAGIALPGNATRWAGAVPAGECDGRGYPATAGRLVLLAGTAPYEATVCLASAWRRGAGVCAP
eukprot:TRINITY_DN20485_c0_g1_i1.p1 TRINITY_DN20485_c0_g1~~TRINITY_DN20485_c0_g1_i1.p1  ORF type:complete len:225 (+),score=38.43 TRINITY_DN20485_c0_g1_i1:43-675(+)